METFPCDSIYQGSVIRVTAYVLCEDKRLMCHFNQGTLPYEVMQRETGQSVTRPVPGKGCTSHKLAWLVCSLISLQSHSAILCMLPQVEDLTTNWVLAWRWILWVAWKVGARRYNPLVNLRSPTAAETKWGQSPEPNRGKSQHLFCFL